MSGTKKGYSSSYTPYTKRAHHYRAKKTLQKVQDPPVCNICGTSQKIEVHHKNKDVTDNRPENLEHLCKPCHMAKHGHNTTVEHWGGEAYALLTTT